MPDSASQVTQLLAAWRNGDPEAPRKLMPLVYDRLRRIARQHLARERAGHTVQALRFFAGMSVQETAEVLGIAPITVKREWSKARAWLYNQLRTEGAE